MEKKRSSEISETPALKMWLVSYQTVIRRYGGQRHPRLDSYETLKDGGELVEWRYLESGPRRNSDVSSTSILEIVELLLSRGADPSLKNRMGMDATSMCSAFPELSGLLAKEQRKKEIRGKYTKTQIAVQTLGRRMTTATPIVRSSK
eukprot:g7205.t1